MNDARYLDARKIARRLVVTGNLIFDSPVHTGGDDPFSLSDQPILRDHNGSPFIPGTTIAGVMRSYAHQSLGGGHLEDQRIASLFGCRWGREDEEQSALITDDAFLLETQPMITELRDGVKIDAATGTAERGKKYDREYLPAGSEFQCRFELLLRGDSSDCDRLGLFSLCLKGLEDGRIHIGARTSRGHGRCRFAALRYASFDFSTAHSLLAWLGCNGGVPADWPTQAFQKAKSVKVMAAALGAVIPEPKEQALLSIRLSLTCPGGFLIRSGGHRAGEADAVHLHRLRMDGKDSEPIISGTALAGALRQRALKIANTLAAGNDDKKAKKLVDDLFGNTMGKNKNPSASKTTVEETVLGSEGRILRQTRIKIDRWRGGAYEEALMEEDAFFGGTAEVSWEVAAPADYEIGLILFLAKDLFTGDLPLGGTVGIGRGRFYGHSGVISHTRPGQGPQNVIIQQGNGRETLEIESGEDYAQACINALHNHLCGE